MRVSRLWVVAAGPSSKNRGHGFNSNSHVYPDVIFIFSLLTAQVFRFTCYICVIAMTFTSLNGQLNNTSIHSQKIIYVRMYLQSTVNRSSADHADWRQHTTHALH